jgi:dTDP-4-amino-4,6-dideoxygalactose transaminase
MHRWPAAVTSGALADVRVPLVDLPAMHAEVAADVDRAWRSVAASGAFILGPPVDEFEREYAAVARVAHCVGVGSGTDALELALRAVGVTPGAEVVLPANTFVATAIAVMRAGARPVLADVDPDTLLLDGGHLDAVLTPATAAVVPVHLYGQMAPMDEIVGLAGSAGAAVVEDAAQCHGALQHGRAPGQRGGVAATSFYPTKNLGAYGDAGAVLTDDPVVAQRCRSLRNYGAEAKDVHCDIGANSRLDALQACVLLAKLPRLSVWNAARAAAAARYDALLEGEPRVRRVATAQGNDHVWHQYVVRVERRDAVAADMAAAGIATGVHYRTPVHLQPAFAFLGHRRGAFPNAESAAAEVLSLPMFPTITAAQQEAVVAALRGALQ